MREEKRKYKKNQIDLRFKKYINSKQKGIEE